jgi:DNA-binding transcriptional LysR family regulator
VLPADVDQEGSLVDKLAAMRAFVAIADRGSLTAAAEALGKAQPTMVRTLANLESALGTRLLRRTTRRLSLTEEGRAYLARCRQIIEDVDEAERALVSGATEPSGELRITAPVTFGHFHVAPALFGFLERHPRLRVELLLLDRIVNLLEEGIDLAVRIGELADSTMIASPVGRMREVVVVAPGLLARFGAPETPDDLARFPAVLFRGRGSGGAWRFRTDGGEWTVPVRSQLGTNQATPAVEACAAGLGVGRFLAYQVAPWVADGRLQIVLERFEPSPVPVSLVYTEARLMTPQLRVLIEHMKRELGDVLGNPLLSGIQPAAASLVKD